MDLPTTIPGWLAQGGLATFILMCVAFFTKFLVEIFIKFQGRQERKKHNNENNPKTPLLSLPCLFDPDKMDMHIMDSKIFSQIAGEAAKRSEEIIRSMSDNQIRIVQILENQTTILDRVDLGQRGKSQ